MHHGDVETRRPSIKLRAASICLPTWRTYDSPTATPFSDDQFPLGVIALAVRGSVRYRLWSCGHDVTIAMTAQRVEREAQHPRDL